MKIEQDDTFKPIKVTLDTREEARTFVSLMKILEEDVRNTIVDLSKEQQDMILRLYNKFTGDYFDI